MNIEINTTITFDNILESRNRVTQHIGGTRSGKTYAILQYLIVQALQSNNDIVVVRKTEKNLK